MYNTLTTNPQFNFINLYYVTLFRSIIGGAEGSILGAFIKDVINRGVGGYQKISLFSKNYDEGGVKNL